ncbi:MAG: hypothetical protein CMP10_00665 [Zetaproteobacteria bacterium]|nr:hypothetical protein [Pseudobdellovibrionaceae bacterium]
MGGLTTKKYLHTTTKRFDPMALVISILGLCAVVVSIGHEEDLSTFIDLRSIFVVVVGTFASLLFQFDFLTSLRSAKLVIISFFGTPDKKIINVAHQLDQAILSQDRLVDLREGEKIDGEILNDVVYMHKKGLLLGEIDEFVTSRVKDEFLGRKVAVELLRRAAIIAPALGLFGTVIGLIGVLKSLSDPAQIGPSMSLALMTTAYGSAIGSLVFTPMAGRLEHHNVIYAEVYEQVLSKISVLIKKEERNLKAEFKPSEVSL